MDAPELLKNLVQPLEWTEVAIENKNPGLSGHWFVAHGIKGSYEIHVFNSDLTIFFLKGPDFTRLEQFKTLTLAKASAERENVKIVLDHLNMAFCLALIPAKDALKGATP